MDLSHSGLGYKGVDSYAVGAVGTKIENPMFKRFSMTSDQELAIRKLGHKESVGSIET